MWAEVLAPGDAVASHNTITQGSVASGAVFTHIPPGTLGKPIFELIDPRGHNPPFGKDHGMPAITGMGIIYPSWVNRMTPPHRWRKNETDYIEDDIMGSHRIEWVFDIGLFRYSREVLVEFLDLENCPFQYASGQIQAQNFFDLAVEELVKIGLPTNKTA
jgi:hypothetical protein